MPFKGKALMGKTPKPVPGGRGRGRGHDIGRPVRPKPMDIGKQDGRVLETAKGVPSRGRGRIIGEPVKPSPRGGGVMSPQSGSNDRNKKATAKPVTPPNRGGRKYAPYQDGKAKPKPKLRDSMLPYKVGPFPPKRGMKTKPVMPRRGGK